MDVSRHKYPFVILVPLFLSLFSFFLWIQTGFEEKAAFVPSRFVHLPTNLPASTYNLSMTLKKMLTDTPLEIKMTHMRSCKRVKVPLSANTVKSTNIWGIPHVIISTRHSFNTRIYWPPLIQQWTKQHENMIIMGTIFSKEKERTFQYSLWYIF